MLLYYKLDENKNPVPCSMEEWGNLNYEKDLFIKKDIVENHLISTVFVGIPLAPDIHKPYLFETMVFKGPEVGEEIYVDRYVTYGEALQGHQKAVQWVIEGCKDEEL